MPNRIPIHLSGEKWTRIMREKTDLRAQTLMDRAKDLFGGVFPGTVPLSPRQELTSFLAETVDLSDFELIFDPEYEQRVRAGLETRVPMSPRWKQRLMMPGEFTRAGKRFQELSERYVDEAGLA